MKEGLNMTDTERYEQIISNLIELLKSKNLDIWVYKERVNELEKKLKKGFND